MSDPTCTVTFTHQGWFGCCPVHIADRHTWQCIVEPRSHALMPLLLANIVLAEIVAALLLWIDARWDVGRPIVVTGLLDEPITYLVHDHRRED